MKAFIVNRVGDFGFALGIAGIFLVYQDVTFDAVFNATPELANHTFMFLGYEVDSLTTICLLLFMGAMGKSAQLPLHTWLPDAMEGPTPVSALIHAATMVTAGVFMIARCLADVRMQPGRAGSGHSDRRLHRLLRGYRRFGAERHQAGHRLFDLLAAWLHVLRGWLVGLSCGDLPPVHTRLLQGPAVPGAGSVIHAVADEQDMRKMGGLGPHIRKTFILMWIGSLALAGIGIPIAMIGFAGFYSKDLIIESAFAASSGVGQFAFIMGVMAAFMTAFYSLATAVHDVQRQAPGTASENHGPSSTTARR